MHSESLSIRVFKSDNMLLSDELHIVAESEDSFKYLF